MMLGPETRLKKRQHEDKQGRCPAEQFTFLGQRFLRIFNKHALQQEMPGEVDITKKGAPQKLARLVRITMPDKLIPELDEPVDVKLNLHADYLVPTEGPNRDRERLNCLSVHCWSPDWVDGKPVGDIATPRVTVGSLVTHDKTPQNLLVLENSIAVAETLIIEQAQPDLRRLLQ